MLRSCSILADEDVRQGLKDFSDWPTFPQLYLQGELVGGLDIVSSQLPNHEPGLMDCRSKRSWKTMPSSSKSIERCRKEEAGWRPPKLRESP